MFIPIEYLHFSLLMLIKEIRLYSHAQWLLAGAHEKLQWLLNWTEDLGLRFTARFVIVTRIVIAIKCILCTLDVPTERRMSMEKVLETPTLLIEYLSITATTRSGKSKLPAKRRKLQISEEVFQYSGVASISRITRLRLCYNWLNWASDEASELSEFWLLAGLKT